jgi:hypothetical protein
LRRKKIIRLLVSFVFISQMVVPISFAEQSNALTAEPPGISAANPSTVTSNSYGVTNSDQTPTPEVNTPEYEKWKQSYVNPNPQVHTFMAMATVSGNRMSNEFIEYAVASNGRYTMGTTGGNPGNPNDNYKKMLYGHPSPSTSYTTIRLDNTNYLFNASSQPMSASSKC